MTKTYFVYECFMSGREKLYKSGLNEVEADEALSELDMLIVNGACNSCAVLGDLNETNDRYVAKRLGLI